MQSTAYGKQRRLPFKQIYRVMRLTALLLLLGLLQVSARSAAQVSLKENSAPLEKVLQLIKKQSGYGFSYDELLVRASGKPVSVEVKNVPVEQALKAVFASQDRLTYSIVGRIISVKEKEIVNMVSLPPPVVRGRVTDEKGQSVAGASIAIKGGKVIGVTNDNGEFVLNNVPDNATLVFSAVTIETFETKLNGRVELVLNARIKISQLEDVAIQVNTGYQQIPKERATGSFTQVDNKTINRNVGVNVLDRLEGMVSGFLVNRNLTNGANNSKYTIRGRSTIFGNANPLIVLDGFPYEGTIEQINPADVESITMLKDAAAASIWGTRAGNGVIVITTKRAKAGIGTNIEFTSSVTVSAKPDLYYPSRLSSSEFIDLESFLYAKGYYTSALNKRYSPVSAAVEIFDRRKNNLISTADSATQINQLKGYDIRNDLNEYFYRPAVLQQYHLGYSGATEKNRFYLSVGYDKNLNSTRTDDYHRLTLNVNNNYTLIKNKLNVFTGINISSGTTNSRSMNYVPYRPYDHIADDMGNALPIVNLSTLRQGYADTAGGGKLLDWSYRPKDEFSPNTSIGKLQYNLTAGVDFTPFPWMNLLANYQYLQETNKQQREESLNDFFARDFINRYSSISGATVTRGIPLGEIMDKSETVLTSQIIRLQANFHKNFGTDHQLNAIAGYEGGDSRADAEGIRLFGYNPATRTNGNNAVIPGTTYRLYYEPGLGTQFQTAPNLEERTNITQSYFANFSYLFKTRYILSGSARKDESNLFGVKSNQKGVPLWSAGLAWIVNKENFYHAPWLPSLKIRATYGYNGNVDKTLSAFLTVRNTGSINEWGSNYSRTLNPPNPDLRWEKVRTINLGIDFAFANNIVSGSLDLYRKYATDLIGNNPIALQSGVSVFRGNGADMLSRGIEVLLQARILRKDIQWTSSLVFNYNKDEVTQYNIKQTTNSDIIAGNYNNPLVGYPYYAVFSFPSAGLSATGMPQGYLNKTLSTDYTGITSLLDAGQLLYHGSASPTFFGNLLNTLGFHNMELSFNISYKLGYYFRRTDVFTGFLIDYSSRAADYSSRWQKPGDEAITRIPALTYPQNSTSGNFFQNSEDLVAKADHIRLQDIRFSYTLPAKKNHSKLYKSAQVFLYGRNLGVLWRANNNHIDPDYASGAIPVPFSISAGLNINF